MQGPNPLWEPMNTWHLKWFQEMDMGVQWIGGLLGCFCMRCCMGEHPSRVRTMRRPLWTFSSSPWHFQGSLQWVVLARSLRRWWRFKTSSASSLWRIQRRESGAAWAQLRSRGMSSSKGWIGLSLDQLGHLRCLLNWTRLGVEFRYRN